MPRRNRRAVPSPTSPEDNRLDLEFFAREHLALHADMVATAEPDELATTVSQHPRTGTRFLSAGDCPDRLALRLVDATDPSDAAGNLAS
jgi:hypothetical protein